MVRILSKLLPKNEMKPKLKSPKPSMSSFEFTGLNYMSCGRSGVLESCQKLLNSRL